MELSVIVPVYNGEKTLPATLSSLLSQAPLPFLWEVVAVDDGSDDQSLAVLQSFSEKFEKINVPFRIKSFENGGVGVCRNRGLLSAKGENILFLDADDRLLEGALLSAMARKKETGAEILLFDSSYLYENGKTAPFEASGKSGGTISAADYMLSSPCPWNKIISRSLFSENGLLFPEGILYEDLALIPSLGIFAKSGIYYEKKCLHAYYQSENSIMRSPWSEKRLDLFSALEILKEKTKDYPAETEYLFWLHLYRSFVWDAFFAGREDAVKEANALMKKHFPRWEQNPIIRQMATKKEIFVSKLFYRGAFFLLRLWKGGK